MRTIEIGDKEYEVKEAKTTEELQQGLKGVKELKENEGMLFYLPDEFSEVTFTMSEMEIPLDIIFIDQDEEVVDVASNCQPGTEAVVGKTNDGYIAYVLEVNPNSGIKIGDELDIDDEDSPVMKVLNPDGSTQMELFGGERIVSRRETKILIKKAKKADLSKDDKDYKSLGRYMFKVIKGQDTRPAEYVESGQ